MKLKSLAIMMVGGLLLTGCANRIVDFTAISTKNVNMPATVRGERTVGQDCVPVVFGPIGIPNMKNAIDRAIENAGPGYDALIDGVVYSVNQSFLVGRTCFKVEGTPVQTTSVTAQK